METPLDVASGDDIAADVDATPLESTSEPAAGSLNEGDPIIPSIVVRAGALGVAASTLRPYHPNETGGLLIGMRQGDGVLVHDCLHVPSALSVFRYERSHDLASALLATYLACLPDESPLGYVGEWHSHPTVHPASDQDLRELADLGKTVQATVALVVFGADPETVRPYGYIGDKDGTIREAIVVRADGGAADGVAP